MADKTYRLDFALSNGSTKSVQFVAPQGEKGGKGDKGDKGDTGATGSKGTDGYTPVKGVDYWTEADQESIVQQVITALGTPVFGTVDGNNNIILTGELVDGTYTVKYENEDGTVTEIGEFTQGVAYTNLLPSSIGFNGSVYNGAGYKDGYRLTSANNNASDAMAKAETGYFTTGWIPYTTEQAAAGVPIYIKGISVDLSAIPNYDRVTMAISYNDGAYRDAIKIYNVVTNGKGTFIELGENYYKFVITSLSGISNWGSVDMQYIRFSFLGSGAGVIITVDEPIE